MVLHFSSNDDSLVPGLGHHDQEYHWRVLAGLGMTPIDIAVKVTQSSGIGRKKVLVQSGSDQLWPPNNQAKQQLTENFQHTWSFHGSPPGMNEKGFYEVRPDHLADKLWYPATITKQRDDGRFDALATMPSSTGEMQEVTVSLLNREDIREASSKQTLKVQERHLLLEVPKEDPLQAALYIDSRDKVTHNFARPTPPHRQHSRNVWLKVDKGRNAVIADVGRAAFDHYLSSEPRCIKANSSRQHHSWSFQVGPFAVHTIEVTNSVFRKQITLTVDGEVLVDASAEDIGCTDHFECVFRLVGHRVLDFEVYETNKDGESLNSKATVTQKQKYSIPVTVSVPDERNMEFATLFVDQTDFRALPRASDCREDVLSMHPQALELTYGIHVPFQVNATAPSGLAAMRGKAETAVEGSNGISGGFFEQLMQCCRANCSRTANLEFSRSLPAAPRDYATP